MRTLFHGVQYQGIANTIVQLIRRRTSGVIALSRPIRPEERHLEKAAWPHRSPVSGKTMSIIDKALDSSTAGSAAKCTAECCLKEFRHAGLEFSLGQISVTLSW